MHPRRVFAFSALAGLAIGGAIGYAITGQRPQPVPKKPHHGPLLLWGGDFRSDAARDHYERELWDRGVDARAAAGNREEFEGVSRSSP